VRAWRFRTGRRHSVPVPLAPVHPDGRDSCNDATVTGSSGPARGGLTAVAAFLRVYEPLEAFPADERAWWRAVAAAGPLTAAEMAKREHAAAIRALTALPPRVVTDLDLTEGAAHPAGIVLQPDGADGRLRVCPVEMSWRALLALEDFQTDIAPTVLPSFLPAAVIDAASVTLAQLVSERSSLTGPHVRCSRWSVPMAWLAVFQPSHRHAEPVDAEPSSRSPHHQDHPEPQELEADVERPRPSVQPAPSSRYLAPMADARRCVARALASVRVADTTLLPLAELEDLGRWLEEFHARSVVELDAGGLGRLPGGSGGQDQSPPVLDGSVADVSRGLADLRAGDIDAAIARLSSVRDTWDEIRAHEHAS
jgi:hypothetical protein